MCLIPPTHPPTPVYTHAHRDDTTATDAGAVILLYMQKKADNPVISWRKITSGLGGFNIRLQVCGECLWARVYVHALSSSLPSFPVLRSTEFLTPRPANPIPFFYMM
jgi:hypothetical protein